MARQKTKPPTVTARRTPRAGHAPGTPASEVPAPGELRVFIRDMVLSCRIGIHQHERIADQRVRINLEATVRPGRDVGDDLDNVVCYGELVTGIRHVVGSGHTNLAETLAERIATMCFEHRRVHAVKIRVEKLEVFPEAESVGVEIERRRP